MSTDYQLSITPVKLSGVSCRMVLGGCNIERVRDPALPSEETIISLGQALLDSTTSWKPAKIFQKGTVKTYSRHKGSQDGAPWHCRFSEHTPEDATFDEFWSKLGENKANNEMKCVSVPLEAAHFDEHLL